VLIITCPHDSNYVPPEFRHLIPQEVINSHRGWDPGAFQLAKDFSHATGAPLGHIGIARILIDGNRIWNLWSEYTSTLSEEQRAWIQETFHTPFYDEFETVVTDNTLLTDVAAHSFVPKLNGIVRRVDIGVLGDPDRPREWRFMNEWRYALKARTGLRIRLNDPYDGRMESSNTYFRSQYTHYTGIVIEVNTGLLQGKEFPQDLRQEITRSLVDVLTSGAAPW